MTAAGTSPTLVQDDGAAEPVGWQHHGGDEERSAGAKAQLVEGSHRRQEDFNGELIRFVADAAPLWHAVPVEPDELPHI